MEPSDLWTYRARLARVVDGDTFYLLVDLGMYVHTTQSIRLRDVDTPELFSGADRDRGAAARDFTAAWFTAHVHGESWPVIIRTQKDRQSFNRYVADVACHEGHVLASALIAEGHTA